MSSQNSQNPGIEDAPLGCEKSRSQSLIFPAIQGQAGSWDVLPLPRPPAKHISPLLWDFHGKPSQLHLPVTLQSLRKVT